MASMDVYNSKSQNRPSLSELKDAELMLTEEQKEESKKRAENFAYAYLVDKLGHNDYSSDDNDYWGDEFYANPAEGELTKEAKQKIKEEISMGFLSIKMADHSISLYNALTSKEKIRYREELNKIMDMGLVLVSTRDETLANWGGQLLKKVRDYPTEKESMAKIKTESYKVGETPVTRVVVEDDPDIMLDDYITKVRNIPGIVECKYGGKVNGEICYFIDGTRVTYGDKVNNNAYAQYKNVELMRKYGGKISAVNKWTTVYTGVLQNCPNYSTLTVFVEFLGKNYSFTERSNDEYEKYWFDLGRKDGATMTDGGRETTGRNFSWNRKVE